MPWLLFKGAMVPGAQEPLGGGGGAFKAVSAGAAARRGSVMNCRVKQMCTAYNDPILAWLCPPHRPAAARMACLASVGPLLSESPVRRIWLLLFCPCFVGAKACGEVYDLLVCVSVAECAVALRSSGLQAVEGYTTRY